MIVTVCALTIHIHRLDVALEFVKTLLLRGMSLCLCTFRLDVCYFRFSPRLFGLLPPVLVTYPLRFSRVFYCALVFTARLPSLTRTYSRTRVHVILSGRLSSTCPSAPSCRPRPPRTTLAPLYAPPLPALFTLVLLHCCVSSPFCFKCANFWCPRLMTMDRTTSCLAPTITTSPSWARI